MPDQHPALSYQIIIYNTVQLLFQLAICILVLFAQIGVLGIPLVILCILASQTLALYEIYNAIKGNIPSHPVTSLMQVAARIGVSITLYYYLNEGPNWIILILGICWALADAIRCLYYLKKDTFIYAWMRYNFFIALYPIGMTLENVIIWHVFQAHSTQPELFYLPFLTMYGIAAIKMYRHMLLQRRKFLTYNSSQVR